MRAIFIGLLLLLSGLAYAEQPQDITPTETINLAVGQTRVLRFQEPIKQAGAASDGVVQVTAQTDRRLSLTGIGAGATVLSVYDDQGNEIYNATVVVGQEVGRIIRMYGTSKDYVGFYCTETACGRADKELNGARDVSSTSYVTPGGVTITRTYGGKQ